MYSNVHGKNIKKEDASHISPQRETHTYSYFRSTNIIHFHISFSYW